MEALNQLFRAMGPARLMATIAGVAIVVASIFLVTMKYSTGDMVPLYGNLSLKDSDEIVRQLEGQNIPYKLRAGGSEVLVPEDKVLRLRMSLASSGLPSNGAMVGYEIFDNSDSFGTSNFVQNVNLIRALEGELSRTISSLNNIESARVHLVMPKRELFSRDSQKPSASVVLSIRGKVPLSKAEINGIVHLVATAVPGLDVERITIMDSAGRPLKLASKENGGFGAAMASSEEYRIEYEKRLKTTIEELLSQSVGAGHVTAEVTADMDFDRVVTNSEIYDPNGQVIRSVQEITNQETAKDGSSNQNVSVSTNLPGNQAQAGGGSQSSNMSEHTDTTTNYEISKTIKNQISEVGTINKLSVAVLIDGIYNEDPKTKEKKYSPRTSQEIAQYESLVKSAIGFDSKRGDVVQITNMQFVTDLEPATPESTIGWLKDQLPELVKTLVTGLVVILVLLLVVRPIAIHAFEMTMSTPVAKASGTESAVASATEPSNPEAAAQSENKTEQGKMEATFMPTSSHKSVNEIFNKYPQETLIAIRKWLNKD